MYLEVNNLKKSYGSDAGAVQVLKWRDNICRERSDVCHSGDKRLG